MATGGARPGGNQAPRLASPVAQLPNEGWQPLPRPRHRRGRPPGDDTRRRGTASNPDLAPGRPSRGMGTRRTSGAPSVCTHFRLGPGRPATLLGWYEGHNRGQGKMGAERSAYGALNADAPSTLPRVAWRDVRSTEHRARQATPCDAQIAAQRRTCVRLTVDPATHPPEARSASVDVHDPPSPKADASSTSATSVVFGEATALNVSRGSLEMLTEASTTNSPVPPATPVP